MELVYLVSDGCMLNGFDKCIEMNVSKFLFMAQYLSEKKDIETEEHNARMQKIKGAQ